MPVIPYGRSPSSANQCPTSRPHAESSTQGGLRDSQFLAWYVFVDVDVFTSRIGEPDLNNEAASARGKLERDQVDSIIVNDSMQMRDRTFESKFAQRRDHFAFDLG